MGPTPTQSDTVSLECSSNNKKSTVPNSVKESYRGKLRKLQFPISDKQEDEIKYIISMYSKLIASSVIPPNLVHYERLCFEGPLAEHYRNKFGITVICNNETAPSSVLEFEQAPEINNQQTYLTIFIEKYEHETLKDWLNDRQNHILDIVQVKHIIMQLVSALKFLTDVGITEVRESNTLEIIHRVHETDVLLAEDHLPNLKLMCLNLEKMLSPDASPVPSEKTKGNENMIKCVALLWLQLLKRCVKNDTCPKELNSKFPEELKLIHEIMDWGDQNFNKTSILSFVSKIETVLRSSCPKPDDIILLNLFPPIGNFVGRQAEIVKIEDRINLKCEDEVNQANVIIIHGPPGIGKTELINQSGKLLIKKQFNILRFNAATSDSLFSSVCSCATHSRIQIQAKDYVGNVKSLKSIFQSILSFFFDKNLLVTFENVEESSTEVTELLQTFKENLQMDTSLVSKHFMILEMKQVWSLVKSVVGNCTEIQLQPFTVQESNLFLEQQHHLSPSSGISGAKNESTDTTKVDRENSPASLELITSYMKQSSIVDYQSFLNQAECFIERHNSIKNIASSTNNLSTSILYAMSLHKAYESFNDTEKLVAREMLGLFQYIDGNYGLCVDTLEGILQQNPASSSSAIHSIVSSLKAHALIAIRGNVIFLSDWKQDSLITALKFLSNMEPPKDTYQSRILPRLKQILSLSYFNSEMERNDCEIKWNIIPHVMQIWRKLCLKDLALAKQFESIPELIINISKKEDKFEFVVSFLKQAADILMSAYANPYDFHVLKLKFILAKEYLLAQSKTNEAFIILKGIHEQSRTDPREFLMLKLKCLIELGQIYIGRQDYDKAISCFQQVQIFAVQKISTVELDSELTVLKSRMMHGYTYLQQGNLDEGKKILLRVIPLLERYAGPDPKETRKLLTQAKFYLATSLRKSGDLVNALMMQKKILKEREKFCGRKHPDTWASKQEMAMLYSSYDNHERALIILRELLEVQEDVLGAPSNRHSLATMNSIAEIEAKLGNFDDALELYEAIDLIEQQVLPENDEMRISSQLNQAEVLVSLGQYKEASDIYDLVYTLKSTSENKTAQEIALCESILSKREKVGRSMEILGNYWLSLTPENVDDPSELSALAKKHEVASEFLENQDYHGALRFLREVLEDCSHLDETNRFHLNVKADMARVLGLVGKFNESFSVYKEIIPLMDATFGEADELTMLCKDTMGQVFLFSGNQFLKRQMSNLKWFLF